jgi:hypothetical protein
MRADFNNCPVDEIIEWTKSALKQCRYVQFEPMWYFFRMPSAVTDWQDYASDPKWADRGRPTENMRRLTEFLISRGE